MTKTLFFTTLLAISATAQTRFDNGLLIRFRAAAANVHTESTLSNSPLSAKGVIALDEGEVSHRLVLGPKGSVLFAYDISVTPVPNNSKAFRVAVRPPDPDRFIPQYVTFEPGDTLRINGVTSSELNGTHIVRPDGTITVPIIGTMRVAGLGTYALSTEFQKKLTGRVTDPRFKVFVVAARRVYPTIAAAREFPLVRVGEAVSLDILYNPSTGEKIFDVIEPAELPPAKQRTAPEDEISFDRIRVSVNGTQIHEAPNSWMIGTAMKISLPQYGTVYLVAKPSTQYAFEPIGRVDRGKLTFPLGNNMIEIVSKSNIFKTRETGIVWILRDSEAKTDGAISLAAGTAETVLPKK